MYRRVTPYARKRTHFTSCKRAGRNPGEVVRQSNIRKWVYDVDPSWFTLEGYITVRSLRTTSTRHLNMPYERTRSSSSSSPSSTSSSSSSLSSSSSPLGQIFFCYVALSRPTVKCEKTGSVFFFFLCQIWAKNLLKFVFNGLNKHLYICVLTAFRLSFPHLETLKKILENSTLSRYGKKKKKSTDRPNFQILVG